jgi:hypothetical protein
MNFNGFLKAAYLIASKHLKNMGKVQNTFLKFLCVDKIFKSQFYKFYKKKRLIKKRSLIIH